VPVGAYGELLEGTLRLRGAICSLHGRRSVVGEIAGSAEEAENLGRTLAEDLLARGGARILERIRKDAGAW